jgi:hypothetical protein
LLAGGSDKLIQKNVIAKLIFRGLIIEDVLSTLHRVKPVDLF